MRGHMRPSLRVIAAIAVLGCASLLGVAPALSQVDEESSLLIHFTPLLFVEINSAQSETRKNRLEFYYCLIGRQEGETYWIEALYEPDQKKSLRFIYTLPDGKIKWISRIEPKEECPVGTVGDLHTHPWGGDPSDTDLNLWVNGSTNFGPFKYDLHLITHTVETQNRVRIFIVIEDEVFETKGKHPFIVGQHVRSIKFSD